MAEVVMPAESIADVTDETAAALSHVEEEQQKRAELEVTEEEAQQPAAPEVAEL